MIVNLVTFLMFLLLASRLGQFMRGLGNCMYGSMRGRRREMVKSILMVAEVPMGAHDEWRPALLFMGAFIPHGSHRCFLRKVM